MQVCFLTIIGNFYKGIFKINKNNIKNFSLNLLVASLTSSTVWSSSFIPHNSHNPDSHNFEKTRPTSIFQAFNMTYQKISETLPDLEKIGYSHIQISPPQKSIEE